MNRKTIIIISITGITIIILALIGLTFGFYYTQIDENTNEKSISVSIGNSSVLFTDLSTDNTSDIIEPGYTTVKAFTVKNTGNVQANYSVYLVNVVNNFNRKEDIIYNLYKIKGEKTNITKDTDFSSWTRVNATENITYPSESSVIAKNEIIENSNDIYTYALKITYINHPTINQNEDQGKTFSGSINIRATETDVNPYSEGTLAYAIIDNANQPDTTTPFIEYQDLGTQTNTTIPMQATSLADEHVLSSIQDYYGTSYFFRGTVQNNYVLFNNFCWRIVRIEGDGGVKLTLAGTPTNNTCENLSTTGGLIQDNGSVTNVPYGEVYQSANYKDYVGGLYTELFNWYNKYFDTSEKKNNVKQNTLWCLGGNDKIGYDPTTGEQADLSVKETWYYFSAGKRFNITYTPSLMCGTDEDKEYEPIGTLTMDEVTLAGAYGNSSINFYLNEQSKMRWWTLSLDLFQAEQLLDYDNAFYVTNDGILKNDWVAFVSGGGAGARPTISLISGTKLAEGKGTAQEPYIINIED